MPISIRGRRSRQEGWAADIGKEVAPSLRQKLANNTSLWIICLIAILASCGALIVISGIRAPQDVRSIKPLIPGDTSIGNYTDEAHQEFVRKIQSMEKKRGVIVDAEFLSDNEFKITVPSGVASDEVAYLSRFAALGIKRHFKIGAIVYAYSRDTKHPDNVTLAATTQWSNQEMNFLTKLERSMDQN